MSATPGGKALEAKILAYLEQHGPSTTGALIKATFSHPYPVSGVVKRLVREKRLVQVDGQPIRYDMHPTVRLISDYHTTRKSPNTHEVDALREELATLRAEFTASVTAWAELVTKLQEDVKDLERRLLPPEGR